MPRDGRMTGCGGPSIVGRLVRFLAMAVLGLLSACAGGRGCGADKLADLPLGSYRTLALVMATVNGMPVVLVLDTGAQRTLLTSAAAARIGLGPKNGHAIVMRGIAGSMMNREVQAGSFTFATVSVSPMTVMVAATRLPEIGGTEPDGVVGADVLSGFDLDLDMAHGHLGVYRAADCAGGPPWTVPYATIAARQSSQKSLVLPVSLDGRLLEAEVDTGASVSTVTEVAAFKTGLNPKTLPFDPTVLVRGANPGLASQRLHRFGSLRIGDDLVPDPTLLITATRFPGWDMLLGSDYWRRKRVWLSYGSGRIFIAPPVGAPTS